MINIQENVLLAPYTTFKIGGPAKFFVEAISEKEIVDAVKFAIKKSIPILVLSGGSNILISDQGFNGLVLRMRNASIKFKKNEIECGAGASFSEIVLKSVRNSLSGLEWAIGVPGNIGGAVRGNAGCFGGEISQAVKSVRVLDMNDFKIKEFKKEKCDFSYRNSLFKQDKNLLIISVILEVQEGKRSESQKMIRETVLKRVGAQPKLPSAGSFFKNPMIKNSELVEKFEQSTNSKVKDQTIPAAWFIDELELRGKKIGGARISEKHANFIVNTGNATAQDVIILSSYIKQQVRDEFGVQLMEEVQLVGF